MTDPQSYTPKIEALSKKALQLGASLDEVNQMRSHGEVPPMTQSQADAIQQPQQASDKVDPSIQPVVDPSQKSSTDSPNAAQPMSQDKKFYIPDVQAPDSILDLVPKVKDMANNAGSVHDVMMLKWANNPHTDLQKLYHQTLDDITNNGTDQALQNELTQYTAKQQANYLDYLQKNQIGGANPADLNAAHAAITDLKDLRKTFSDYVGYTSAVVDSYKGEDISDLAARKHQVKMYAFGMLQRELEKQGGWEAFYNTVTNAVAPTFIKDAHDLVGKGLFNSVSNLKKAVNAFQSLDPAEQIPIVEQLLPNMMKAYDNNPYSVASALSMFFSPNYGTKAAAGEFNDLIAVEAVATPGIKMATGLASGAAKEAAKSAESIVAKGARKPLANAAKDAVQESFSKAESYKQLGNNQQAAMQNLVNTSDHMELWRKAGLSTKEDAISSLSPWNLKHGPFGGGYVDNISPEQIRILEDNGAPLRDMIASAGNKMSRKERMLMEEQKRQIGHSLEDLKARRQESIKRKNSIRSGEQKKAWTEELNTMNDNIKNLEASYKRLDEMAKSQTKSSMAEAELSRIEQGHVPSSIYEDTVKTISKTPLTKAIRQNMREQALKESSITDGQKPVTVVEKEATRKQKLSNTTPVREDSAGPITNATPEDMARAGLSQNFLDQLNQEQRGPVQTALGDILKPDLLKAHEIDAAKDAAIERFKAKYQDAGKLIRDIQPYDVTPDGMKVKITMEDGVETKDVKFTRNDAGQWKMEASVDRGIAQTLTKVFSPEARLGGLSEPLVEDATFLGQQAARVRNALSEVFHSAVAGLSNKEKEQVYSLLLASDEEGVLYHVSDLLSGTVETALGKMPYSEKVAAGYYKMAAAMDESHSFADYAIKRRLEIEGFQELQFIGKDGGIVKEVAKPYNDWRGVNIGTNDYVYNVNTDTYVKASNVAKYENTKWKPARLIEPKYVSLGKKGPEETANKTKIEYYLVKDLGAEGGVTFNSLPERVLNKVEGVYVPRIYKPGYHFVRDFSNPRAPVIRAFKTRAEANDWMANAKAQGDKAEYKVFADKDFTNYERLIGEADSYGGLYTGRRKKRLLMVEDKGKLVRPERMAANDAIQRYINAVSEVMPFNEYRLMQIERFKNTVNKLAEQEGKANGFSDPTDWRSQLTLSNTNQKVLMDESRKYMQSHLAIPTNEETRFQDLMQRVAMLSEGKYGKFGEKVKDAALRWGTKDPVASLKSLTFNADLGWFNVRQLYVQAQNAALAVSMYPQYALQASRDAMAMRAAYFMPEEAQRTIAHSMGMDGDTLVSNIKEFRRSGLEQSIKRNADLAAPANKIGHVSLETFRKLSRQGLRFYEEGELFSRLVTWNIAKRKGPGLAAKLDDKGIRQMSEEVVRLHMNMQKENAAWWQKNFLTGPATQFLQVQAKMVENLLPVVLGGTGKWTAKEKSMVLAGQILLYGTVGVPIADEAVNYIAGQTGKTPEQLHKENPYLSEQINRGAIGVLGKAMGFNNDFSSAGSILEGLSDNGVVNLINSAVEVVQGGYDQTGVFNTFAGPSLSTVKRADDALGTAFGSIRDLVYNPSFDNLGQEALKDMDRFAEITSSWNNARKLWQIDKLGGVYSSRNRLLLSKDNIKGWNFRTQFARMLGFPTNAEQDYWRQSNVYRDRKNDYKQSLDAMLKNYNQFMRDGDLAAYQRDNARILQPHDVADQIKLKQTLFQNIIDGKDANSRMQKQFLRDYINSGGQVQVPFTAETQ